MDSEEILVVEPPSGDSPSGSRSSSISISAPTPVFPPRVCCIGGCTSTTEKSKSEHLLMPSPSVSFHQMPSHPFGLRQAWINIIRASRSEPEWLPNDSVFVCNLHFHPHEIVIPVDETLAQIDFSDGKNIVPSLRLGDYGVTKIGDNEDDDDSIESDINILKGESSFNFVPMKIKEEPKSEEEYEDSSFSNTFDDEQPCSSSSIIKPGKRKPKPTWSLRELWDDDEERNVQENDSSEYEPSSDSDSDSGNESKGNRVRNQSDDDDDDDIGGISDSNLSKRPKLSTPNSNQRFILQSSGAASSNITPKTHIVSNPKKSHRPASVVMQKSLNFGTGSGSGFHQGQNQFNSNSPNSSPNFLNFQLKNLGLKKQVIRSPQTGMMTTQYIQTNKPTSSIVVPGSTPTTATASTPSRKRILMPYFTQSDPVMELIALMQQIQSRNRTTITDHDFYDQCISLFNQIFDRLKLYPPSEAKKNVSLQLSVLVDIAKQRKTQGLSTANQVHFSLVSKKILELLNSWPKDPNTRPPSKSPASGSISSHNIRISANHLLQAVNKSSPVPEGTPTQTPLLSPQTLISSASSTPYGHMTKLMDNKFSLNSGTGKMRVTPIQDMNKTTNLLSSKNLQNLKNLAAPSTPNSALKPMPPLIPKSSTASVNQPPEVVTLSDDDDEDDFAPLIESVTTLTPSAALALAATSTSVVDNTNAKQQQQQQKLPIAMPNLLPSPAKGLTSTTSKNTNISTRKNHPPQSSSDTSPLKVIHSSTVLEKFAQFTKFILNSEVPPPLPPEKAHSVPWMGHADFLDAPHPGDPDGTLGETEVTPEMIVGAASQSPIHPLGKYPPNVMLQLNLPSRDQHSSQHQHPQQQHVPSPASNVTASSIAAGIRLALKNQLTVHAQNINSSGQVFTIAGAGAGTVTTVGVGAGTRFPSPKISPAIPVSASFSDQLRNLAAHSVQSNGQQTNRIVAVSSANVIVNSSGSGSTTNDSLSVVSNNINMNMNGNKRIVLVSQANGHPTYALLTTPSLINSNHSLSYSPSSSAVRLATLPVPSTTSSQYSQQQQQMQQKQQPLLRPSLNPSVSAGASIPLGQQKILVVQKKPSVVDEVILLSDDSDEECPSQQSQNQNKSQIPTSSINCISLNSSISTSNNVIGQHHIPQLVKSSNSASAGATSNYSLSNSDAPPNSSANVKDSSTLFADTRVEDQSACEEEMLLGI